MKLAIIIVNYRTAQLVVDCVRSIKAELHNLPDTIVYIVDECSKDQSVEIISSAREVNSWTQWTVLISSEVNLGFAHGNNLALHQILSDDAKPDYILLLNPDTRVLHNSIFSLVDFLDKNSLAGIAGSQLFDKGENTQSAAFRFPSITSEFERALHLGFATRLLSKWTVTIPHTDQPTQVDWVAGTSMMIRFDVLNRVGLLDEDYFLYYEEVDFMRRAANKGVTTWIVPASRIIHIGGQSTGVIDGELTDGTRPKYLLRSRQLYFCKNHGIVYYWVANLSWMIGTILRILRLVITGKDIKGVWRDFWQFTVFTFSKSDRDIVQ